MRPVIRKPKVTAGLKCPPEMCPTADTITAIASPNASATPTEPGVGDDRADADEDEGEGADELGDETAGGVALHRAGHCRDGIGRRRPGTAERVLLAWPHERRARRAARTR